MKRLAIPIQDYQLSPYFGKCNYYLFIDMDDLEGYVSQKKDLPIINSLEELPAWLSHNHITDIVAHKMDNSIVNLFSEYKINVFLGIPIKTVEKIVEDYMNGQLIPDKKLIKEILKN